jgi:hypothetical protein
MTLQNEVDILRTIYAKTEVQFINVIQTIPLDSHYNTHSPKLSGLLIDICGQIEYLAEQLCIEYNLSLKSTNEKFTKFFDTLNKNSILERQNVYVLPIRDTIKPFLIFSRDIPDWWHWYNESKQDQLADIHEASIKNTLYALAGLYTLHHLAYNMSLYGTDVFDQQKWHQDWRVISNHDMLVESIKKKQRPFRSEIFYCMTKYEDIHTSIE